VSAPKCVTVTGCALSVLGDAVTPDDAGDLVGAGVLDAQAVRIDTANAANAVSRAPLIKLRTHL
jgi:hypothetical protein